MKVMCTPLEIPSLLQLISDRREIRQEGRPSHTTQGHGEIIQKYLYLGPLTSKSSLIFSGTPLFILTRVIFSLYGWPDGVSLYTDGDQSIHATSRHHLLSHCLTLLSQQRCFLMRLRRGKKMTKLKVTSWSMKMHRSMVLNFFFYFIFLS